MEVGLNRVVRGMPLFVVIAEELGIPIYCTTNSPTDLVHTGGNFMADGLGTAFSSRLVLDENDATNQWGVSNHSEEEIDQIMLDYPGTHGGSDVSCWYVWCRDVAHLFPLSLVRSGL